MSKKKELPAWFDGIKYSEGETITNQFSGESYDCSADEAAMYDLIMGANLTKNWSIVQKGCDWFRKANPTAYMVLLD
jgi:hypothetical protein|tara:strand:- start:336 stop:566 length:231 start_codon:yes stop_codon:yes gene_type:complete